MSWVKEDTDQEGYWTTIRVLINKINYFESKEELNLSTISTYF